MVHARAVLGKLIRGDVVSLHVRRIRVAAGTGLRHVQGVHFRTRVAGRAEIMDTMAVDAYRNLGVPLRQALAVHAGFVLCQLVGPERRIVLAQERAVGMTVAAKFWNLRAQDLATESCRLAHGIHIRLCRIATMTNGASQSFLRMDVMGEFLSRYL